MFELPVYGNIITATPRVILQEQKNKPGSQWKNCFYLASDISEREQRIILENMRRCFSGSNYRIIRETTLVAETVLLQLDILTALCHDCGVSPGHPHADNCDVAQCLNTGLQRLMCQSLNGNPPSKCDGKSCGKDIWTGEWPGAMECREFGWYVLPEQVDGKFVRCDPSAPGATEDLNRLMTEAMWDKESRRWMQRVQISPEGSVSS